MKLLKEYIRLLVAEGLKKKPKLIFMAGSPGAGKSTVRRLLNLTGFEIVDPDEAYEAALKDAKMSLNIAEFEESFFDINSQMKDAIEADDKAKIKKLKPEYDRLKGLASARAKAFVNAQAIAKQKQEELAEKRKSMIIDGTGGDFNRINKIKKTFEQLGYETGMIYVYVPLEVSQERNRARGETGDRTLRDRTVEKSWTAVQSNLEPYRELFGDRFFYIDATDMNNFVANVKNQVKAFVR
jgi:dephospho-CoA kinase